MYKIFLSYNVFSSSLFLFVRQPFAEFHRPRLIIWSLYRQKEGASDYVSDVLGEVHLTIEIHLSLEWVKFINYRMASSRVFPLA